jgi:hypothetical protein
MWSTTVRRPFTGEPILVKALLCDPNIQPNDASIVFAQDEI